MVDGDGLGFRAGRQRLLEPSLRALARGGGRGQRRRELALGARVPVGGRGQRFGEALLRARGRAANRAAALAAAGWYLNPVALNLCTRGSGDASGAMSYPIASMYPPRSVKSR